MTLDPKWLEVLKARGPQAAAVAVACALAFVLIQRGDVPNPGALWVAGLAIAGLIFGCLAVASFLGGLVRVLRPAERFRRWNFNRLSRKRVAEHIPHMSRTDREIIGYLLARNQKFFTADVDGGRATTLISAGIVVPAARPGQVFDQRDCPFAIPDPVWKALIARREVFPDTVDDTDGPPWRVHWMAR